MFVFEILYHYKSMKLAVFCENSMLKHSQSTWTRYMINMAFWIWPCDHFKPIQRMVHWLLPYNIKVDYVIYRFHCSSLSSANKFDYYPEYIWNLIFHFVKPEDRLYCLLRYVCSQGRKIVISSLSARKNMCCPRIIIMF